MTEQHDRHGTSSEQPCCLCDRWLPDSAARICEHCYNRANGGGPREGLKAESLRHQVEDAILAWTGQYPYSDKGYCYLCGEIDGHKDVDWPLGVHESGETEHAILPCPIELLESKP